MVHENQMRIFAKSGKRGLDIYLREKNGNDNYIVTRRWNKKVFDMLKCGQTIGQLKRVKPTSKRDAQKLHHYSIYLVKLSEEYILNG